MWYEPKLRWLPAGTAYFMTVFAVGFLLGTLRVLVLLPALGELTAVALETPVMLAACWFLCRWAVRRWQVPGEAASRLAMGALAFALLMGAEFLLATLLFGLSPGDWLAAMGSTAGVLGLAGQVLFAMFPLLQGTGVRT